jgi:hypothetical protein
MTTIVIEHQLSELVLFVGTNPVGELARLRDGLH